MDDIELRRRVEDLEARTTRLEGGRAAAAAADTSLVERLIADLTGDTEGRTGAGTVVYAGAGPWGTGTVAYQIIRSWEDVLSASEETIARVMSALANPTRIRIIGELLGGPMSTGDLSDRLERSSAGQLFHHLKELMTAGIVHQPERGTYAISDRYVIPLLVVGSAAIDMSTPAPDREPG